MSGDLLATTPPGVEDVITPAVLDSIVKGYKPDLTLIKYQAKSGSEKGDGYNSVLYALELDLKSEKAGSTETLHVMVKAAPKSAFQSEMMKETRAFEKEVMMYNDVFPLLEETLKNVPDPDRAPVWPVSYSARGCNEVTDYLAMENLKAKDAGYKLGNRFDGVDFNTASLILRCLARYHATSYARFNGSQEAMINQFPLLVKGMFNDLTPKLKEVQHQFMAQALRTQAVTLGEMGDEETASRMEKMASFDFQSWFGKLLGTVEHAVIAHGDCWINNMMLKFEENPSIPTHVKFFDFQLPQATTRFLDVHYFMFTSVKIDVLLEREEDLLLTYYSEFTNHAEKLGVNTKARGLTLEAFMEEADKFRYYGVFLGTLLAPMMTANKEDITDFSTLSEDNFNSAEDMDKLFKDMQKGRSVKKVQTIISKFLPRCHESVHFM